MELISIETAIFLQLIYLGFRIEYLFENIGKKKKKSAKQMQYEELKNQARFPLGCFDKLGEEDDDHFTPSF